LARAKASVAAASVSAARIITGRRPKRSTRPAAQTAVTSWPTGKAAKISEPTASEKP
jgi:hypothetical protein